MPSRHGEGPQAAAAARQFRDHVQSTAQPTTALAQPFEVILNTETAPHMQWIRERRLGLGGTDAAALLGHNPWKSVTTLWYEKLNTDEEPAEAAVSEAAYWGQTLEHVVAGEFSRRTGLMTRRSALHLRSTAYPWVRGTLDYWVYEPGPESTELAASPTSFLEVKTTAWHRGRDWRNGLLPGYVRSQVLHYLGLTGYDHCHVACLVGGQAFFHIEVERPQALVDDILDMEQRFWWYVDHRIEPPDPFSHPDILDPHEFAGAEVVAVVQLDDAQVARVRRYHEANRVNSETYDEVTAIRDELGGVLYGGRLGVHDGRVLLEVTGARDRRRLHIYTPEGRPL